MSVPAAVQPAPAPGVITAPAAPSGPPRIGSVSDHTAALAISAVPTVGSVAVAPATTVSSSAPTIGSVTPSASQRLAPADDYARVRDPYEPPTAKIPEPPQVPGKWVPQYTRDKKKYVVPGLEDMRQTATFIRATSHAKTLDDTSSLTDWRLRGTVLGLARNPELLDGLDLDGAEHISELSFWDKLTLSGVSNKAMRRVGGDDGSDFGDKVHGYLQVVLEGVMTFEQVPQEIQPYLAVLFAAMRQHGLSFVQGMVERTVFIPSTGLVGTFDFLAQGANGELLIGDLKTSSSIDFSWLSIAIQLAQYANAQLMLAWNGSHWEAMPPVSKVYAVVASVPKDEPTPTCRIYVVDMALGTEMMDIATRVREIHETALRAASNTALLQERDELIAWAAGDPVSLSVTRAIA
ncbi:Uncharacterised protein [Mycobacteroides abscessus subsp. abscessus]|uniref:hypothetical protein n=1 Tax=Mycobacteroides abscessus TaxID=36809 RepID=UPI0009298605|nr:hypothetical protein [Mycobacteroides abscessus]SIL99942.1 Uncharacterised protein [Mycobacteroides abscessus subsp. abscessus]SLC79095.1 Uncharacterised protein [Mycobacteroides abscessus subsp. abscessus]